MKFFRRKNKTPQKPKTPSRLNILINRLRQQEATNWKRVFANRHSQMVKNLFPNMNSSNRLRIASRLRNILKDF
jgi:hypothetical protein